MPPRAQKRKKPNRNKHKKQQSLPEASQGDEAKAEQLDSLSLARNFLSSNLYSIVRLGADFISQHKLLIISLSLAAMIASAAASGEHDDDTLFINPDGVEEGYVKWCFRNAGDIFAFKFPIFIDEYGGDRTLEYIGKGADCRLSSGNGGAPREIIDCLTKATQVLFARKAGDDYEPLAQEISAGECMEGASNFMFDQVAPKLGLI